MKKNIILILVMIVCFVGGGVFTHFVFKEKGTIEEPLPKAELAEGLRGKYGIDKNVDRVDGGIEIKKLEEKLFPVDVIVITPFFMYKEIEEELMELVNYPIVSIEDVVNFL